MDPAQQPTGNMILNEAYRPVAIREGDKTIELPAIQAMGEFAGLRPYSKGTIRLWTANSI